MVAINECFKTKFEYRLMSYKSMSLNYPSSPSLDSDEVWEQLQQILIFGEVFLHCNLGLEDVDLEALQPSGLVRPGWNDSGIDSFYLGPNLL